MPQETPLLIPDEASRDEKRRQMRLKLERTLSPEKITAYVKAQLGDRNSMLASELLLSEGDTFIKMIYIRLYGQRKRVGYRLEMKNTVEKEGFRFRDFLILKAPGKNEPGTWRRTARIGEQREGSWNYLRECSRRTEMNSGEYAIN